MSPNDVEAAGPESARRHDIVARHDLQRLGARDPSDPRPAREPDADALVGPVMGVVDGRHRRLEGDLRPGASQPDDAGRRRRAAGTALPLTPPLGAAALEGRRLRHRRGESRAKPNRATWQQRKLARRPLLRPEPAVSGPDPEGSACQNAAESRELPGLLSDSGAGSLLEQTGWRWRQSVANSSLGADP